MDEKLLGCPIPACDGEADPTYPACEGEDWVGCSRAGCVLHGAPVSRGIWQSLLRRSDELGAIIGEMEDTKRLLHVSTRMDLECDLCRWLSRLSAIADSGGGVPSEVWVGARDHGGLTVRWGKPTGDQWNPIASRDLGWRLHKVHGAPQPKGETVTRHEVTINPGGAITLIDVVGDGIMVSRGSNGVMTVEAAELDCNDCEKPEQWDVLHPTIAERDKRIGELKEGMWLAPCFRCGEAPTKKSIDSCGAVHHVCGDPGMDRPVVFMNSATWNDYTVNELQKTVVAEREAHRKTRDEVEDLQRLLDVRKAREAVLTAMAERVNNDAIRCRQELRAIKDMPCVESCGHCISHPDDPLTCGGPHVWVGPFSNASGVWGSDDAYWADPDHDGVDRELYPPHPIPVRGAPEYPNQTHDGLPCPGTCVTLAGELEEVRADLGFWKDRARDRAALYRDAHGERSEFRDRAKYWEAKYNEVKRQLLDQARCIGNVICSKCGAVKESPADVGSVTTYSCFPECEPKEAVCGCGAKQGEPCKTDDGLPLVTCMNVGELIDEIVTFEPSVEGHEAFREQVRRIKRAHPDLYSEGIGGDEVARKAAAHWMAKADELEGRLAKALAAAALLVTDLLEAEEMVVDLQALLAKKTSAYDDVLVALGIAEQEVADLQGELAALRDANWSNGDD